VPVCDEDGCPNDDQGESPVSICNNCAVLLCTEHCDGDGSECVECGAGIMEAV
jgi:hypothetical protein